MVEKNLKLLQAIANCNFVESRVIEDMVRIHVASTDLHRILRPFFGDDPIFEHDCFPVIRIDLSRDVLDFQLHRFAWRNAKLLVKATDNLRLDLCSHDGWKVGLISDRDVKRFILACKENR